SASARAVLVGPEPPAVGRRSKRQSGDAGQDTFPGRAVPHGFQLGGIPVYRLGKAMANHQCKHCMSRRAIFDRASDGLDGAALATLLSRDLYAADGSPEGHRRVYDLKPRPPHFVPKAKSVIHLFMNGGPSQMDLFDPKPALEKHHGESYFDKVAADLTAPEGAGGLLRSPFQFARHGQSGTWVSEVMPHLSRQVDEIAVIKSMFTTHPDHQT